MTQGTRSPGITADQHRRLVTLAIAMVAGLREVDRIDSACELCEILGLRVLEHRHDPSRFAIDPASMPDDYPDKLAHLHGHDRKKWVLASWSPGWMTPDEVARALGFDGTVAKRNAVRFGLEDRCVGPGLCRLRSSGRVEYHIQCVEKLRRHAEPCPCCKGKGSYWVATYNGSERKACKRCHASGTIFPHRPSGGK